LIDNNYTGNNIKIKKPVLTLKENKRRI